ncbi:MAG: RNA polymerase sigma factor [Deltaproteobacteria bacterium]
MSPPDAHPLQTLYAEQLDHVWNTLRRFGIRGSEVEDLTQEVFLRAFRDHDRYDAGRPVRPWLSGIASHVAIDFLRRRGVSPVTAEEPPDVASPEAAPDQEAARAQERRVLERILGSLDVDRRSVLVMHELLGHTAPEIAAILEIPLNTVYSRLRLARVDFEAAVESWRQGAPRQ